MDTAIENEIKFHNLYTYMHSNIVKGYLSWNDLHITNNMQHEPLLRVMADILLNLCVRKFS